MKLKIAIISSLIMLSSCGPQNDPKEILFSLVESFHFIPFELPMATTRVGTVIKGDSKAIYLVARPEKCFPDLPGMDSMRFVNDVSLPSQYKKFELTYNVGAGGLFSTGNVNINFKANGYHIQTVQLEFQGATVEQLEESNFIKYYLTDMTPECRKIVEKNPFISQGLRIESMQLIFKDDKGGTININGIVDQVVDISANVNWRVIDNYTLKIDTPKYIGYRVGLMRGTGETATIVNASTIDDKGGWVFDEIKPMDITDGPETLRLAEPLE